MGNLLYPRTVTVERSTVTFVAGEGATLTPSAVITNMPASIQPKRDRNLMALSTLQAVGSAMADAMVTWTMLCNPPIPLLEHDLVTDDLGVSYTVESVYATPMGAACIIRVTVP